MKPSSIRIERRQAVAVVGCSLMILGVALPAWSFPIVGDVSYMQRADVEGWMLLALAFASAVLAFTGASRSLWLTGSASVLVVAWSIVTFFVDARDLRRKYDALHSKALVEAFLGGPDAMQLQWGLLVLAAGIGCVLTAAAMKGAAPGPAPGN